MTYNDPAHSLAVLSLIPVRFVMATLTVVINDWILLPCYVFVMFMLKLTYKIIINHEH